MGSIVVDLTLPIPGRVLQPDDEREYPQCTNVLLSMSQALRSRNSIKRNGDLCGSKSGDVGVGNNNDDAESRSAADQFHRGRDLIWTTDIGTELPIKIAER